jgi:hypothetical protein
MYPLVWVLWLMVGPQDWQVLATFEDVDQHAGFYRCFDAAVRHKTAHPTDAVICLPGKQGQADVSQDTLSAPRASTPRDYVP